jgi:hypothetical protein
MCRLEVEENTGRAESVRLGRVERAVEAYKAKGRSRAREGEQSCGGMHDLWSTGRFCSTVRRLELHHHLVTGAQSRVQALRIRRRHAKPPGARLSSKAVRG